MSKRVSDIEEIDTEDIFADNDTNNTTVPLLLSDKVLSDKNTWTWYMVRLTPDNADDYNTKDIVDNILIPLSENVWFLSEEFSKKGSKHYHMVFRSYKDPREDIKEWLLTIYTAKWKKQDGNKRYNLQEPKELEVVFIYTSKDGKYSWGDGINSKFIEYVNSKSYQKKDSRIGQLLIARTKFVKGEITDLELFRIACQIYISTSATGSLNVSVAKSFLIGARAFKDPDYIDKLYKDIN